MAVSATLRGRKERQVESPFEECFATLGEVHDESVYGAIERLVQAGEHVGLSGHDLIRVLKGGVSLEALLDLIEVRMTANSAHVASRAA